MSPRYAVYFAPATDTPLWAFGCRVIGYDASTGAELPQSPANGISEDSWRRMTAEPRRYGFHATLKAPFRLREGATEIQARDAFDDFCARRPRIRLEGLAVANLDGFVALVPIGADHDIGELALAAVEAFEPLRAPLGDADRERRMQAGLTPSQIESLDRYGYPFVGPDFRFHMTLTGRLSEADTDIVLSALRRQFAVYVPVVPVEIDRLALFKQARPDAAFRILTARTLAGAGSKR
jgi:putative phosphonate metabolism protein